MLWLGTASEGKRKGKPKKKVNESQKQQSLYNQGEYY
jgi:hypothetical protein